MDFENSEILESFCYFQSVSHLKVCPAPLLMYAAGIRELFHERQKEQKVGRWF
jgi:hypothetical protein